MLEMPNYEPPRRGKNQRLADKAGKMYLGKQDDELFQPILVYLPLLAHGSGIGGVVSSERLLSFS
jgi:hypothetical protein